MHRALNFIILVLVTGVIGCGSTTPESTAKKVVKVGIILTYSGADASIGEAIDHAAELYPSST
jgi:hypothetical protein